MSQPDAPIEPFADGREVCVSIIGHAGALSHFGGIAQPPPRSLVDRVLQRREIQTLDADGHHVCAPVFVEGVVVALASGRTDQPLTDASIRRVEAFAVQLSAAMRSSRLVVAAQRRAADIASLGEIGRDVASAHDVRRLPGRILARMRELLRVRDIALYLPTDEEDVWQGRSALGVYADELQRHVVRRGVGIIGSVLATGEAEIVNYANRDPRAVRIPDTPMVDDATEPMMCAPMRDGDRLQGVVVVWRGRAEAVFEPSDLDLFVYLTEQAAIALATASQFEELASARRFASAASDAKSRFLANMSHEVRTPMNAIVTMAELLARTGLDDQQRTCVETIRHGADGLLTILDDVLDVSRIEFGQLKLNVSRYDIRLCVRRAVDLMAAEASRRGLGLRFRVAADVPRRVRGDSGRVRQVLLNLLANAIKFTGKGSVSISVAQHPEGLSIAVQDTGIGIAVADHQRIFDTFTQVDASTTREQGGTGLGLAICTRLVDRMGGRMELASELGKGSRFTVILPLDVDEDSGRVVAPAPDRTAGPRRLRVLVAEDNLVNQDVAQLLLEHLGHEVSLVENGVRAIEAVTAGRFDVVFMDVQMPEMDGLEAARWIVREVSPRPHIFAMTASVHPSEKQRCFDAGMDGFLAKPLRVEDVEAALIELGDRPEPPDGSPIDPGRIAAIGASVDHDPDAFVAAIAAVMSRFEEAVAMIEVAGLTEDAAALTEGTAELRAVATEVGASALVSACDELHRWAKADDVAHARDLLRRVGVHVRRRIISALNRYLDKAGVVHDFD